MVIIKFLNYHFKYRSYIILKLLIYHHLEVLYYDILAIILLLVSLYIPILLINYIFLDNNLLILKHINSFMFKGFI